MLQAVFYVFRRRLTVAQAIAFIGVLPPVLRAIFVSDWSLNKPQLSFDHNLSTETAIEDVTETLKRHVDARAFADILEAFTVEARQFWKLAPA
jgi:uncharacterized protein (DUF2267 family)